jgi:glycosyltransferase involved in cell wall biosynthesis
MKIFLIAPATLPVPPRNYGGVERVVYTLAEGLARHGHQVTLAAPSESVAPPGVSLLRTGQSGKANGEKIALEMYRNVLGGFDVVSDHSEKKAVRTFAEAKGTPYVPTCHTLTLGQADERLSRLVSLSRAHAAYIEARYGVGSRVIYNGIDLHYYPAVKAMSERENLVYVGRLTPEKGGAEAVKICRRLNLQLDVVEGTAGESMAMKAARMLASIGIPVDAVASRLYTGSIEIPGLLTTLREIRQGGMRYRRNVSESEKLRILGSASALLLPLRYQEPFGLTAVEAMGCGTPVIAYRSGAMPELIEQGETGFVVDPEDEGALKDAISGVHSLDPSACRKRVEDHFSSEVMVRSYVTAFEDAVRGTRW